MHILLTDVLACPRCGPPYGLILVPESVRERRVESGFLGCANCRERYAIRGGVADLRTGARGPEPPVPPAPGEALRLAALMGVAEGPGIVLVAGPGAATAAEIAALVPDLEVVAVGTLPGAVESGAGVSAILVDERLPVQSGKLRAVALTGSAVALLEDAARAVAPAGRVVIEPVTAEAEARMASLGLRVVAHEGPTLVAMRSA